MKKKITGITMMAAIALAASWSFSQNKNDAKLSDLALSNMEALASGEKSDCPSGCTSNGSGCWCNAWYPSCGEKSW